MDRPNQLNSTRQNQAKLYETKLNQKNQTQSDYINSTNQKQIHANQTKLDQTKTTQKSCVKIFTTELQMCIIKGKKQI